MRPLRRAALELICLTLCLGMHQAVVSADLESAVLVNGGFETGDLSGWTAVAGGLPESVSGVVAHEGRYAALLGMPVVPPASQNRESALISQQVTLPADARALTYWYRIYTNYDQGWDDFCARVYPLQDPAHQLERCDGYNGAPTHPPEDLGWRRAEIDLTAYAGQTVIVTFENRNRHADSDPIYGIWTYVDQVAVARWQLANLPLLAKDWSPPLPPTATVTPSAKPTQTLPPTATEPSATATATPTVTSSLMRTATFTSTRTATRLPTATASPPASATSTATQTPSGSQTPWAVAVTPHAATITADQPFNLNCAYSDGNGIDDLRYVELLIGDESGSTTDAILLRYDVQHNRILLQERWQENSWRPHDSGGLAETVAWVGQGRQTNSRYGYAADTAGDVNGDGYDDIMVGSYLYDDGQQDAGRALVYLGSPSGLEETPIWSLPGNQAGAWLGMGISAAGDVNHDGYDDLLVSAPKHSGAVPAEGRVQLFLGSVSGPAAAPAWTRDGGQADSYYGQALNGAGDVNNDGYDDVLIGAWMFDKGSVNEGVAYLHYGDGASLSAEPDWTVEINKVAAAFGFAVNGIGDANGDGYPDVIVGAYYYDGLYSNAGLALVYLGGADGIDRVPDWRIEGTEHDAYLGSAAAGAGDVNGDGYDDVIIGGNGYGGGSERQDGRAYAFYGSPTGLPDANGDGVAQLSDAAWMGEADLLNAAYGAYVGSAGDVNGDGCDDILVGAPNYDGRGRAYLYLGSSDGLASSPAWVFDGATLGARCGYPVNPAGDVNGDGLADVVVGSSEEDHGYDRAGAAYVFQGRSAGLEPGAAGTVKHGLVRVQGQGCDISLNADTLTVSYQLVITDAFVGAHRLYLRATDQGGLSSGWQELGTLTVQSAS